MPVTEGYYTNGTAVVTACFLIALFEGYDLQSMGVAAPMVSHAFGFGPKTMGYILSISLVGLALAAGPGGRLADKIGRKPVLIGSVLAFSLFSGLTVFAWDDLSLLVFRFLTGAGLGGAFANLIAIVADAGSAQSQTRRLSLMYCGLPAGGMVAAFVAGVVQGNWHSIFYVGSLGPLAALLLVYALLPSVSRGRPGPGASGSSSAQVLFRGQRWQATVLLWGSYFFTLFAVYLLLNWLPSLMIARGLPRSAALWTAFSLNGGAIVGSLILGVLGDKGNRYLVLALTYLGMGLGVSFLAAAQGEVLLAAAFVAGFFIIGGQLLLYAAAPSLYPPAERGLGTGAAVAVGRIGAITSPVAAGLLLSAGLGASGVIWLLMPGLIIALIAMSMVVRIMDGEDR